jgi:predicted P-loop ATPase
VDLPSFAASLLPRAEHLLPEWFPAGKWNGKEFRVGNIRGEPGKSLSVNTLTGAWADFAETKHRGNDILSLFAAKEGLQQGEAAKRLGWTNGHRAEPPQAAPELIPADPPPIPVHAKWRVPPVAVYDYGPLLRIARYEHEVIKEDNKKKVEKDFRPYTWRNGRWSAKHLPAGTRPLFGLDLLAAKPAAPVLLVEGEKCALAARAVIPAYIVMTWSGGAGGVAGTDWEPLHGRVVAIWPDADEPGAMAAAAIVEQLLPHLAGKELRVFDQTDMPEGWDIANAIAEGWDSKRITDHIGRNEGSHTHRYPQSVPVSIGRKHDGKPAIESVTGTVQHLQLKCNSGNVPYPTIANASLVIQSHPDLAGKLWFDTFRQQIRTTIDGKEREWIDADDSNMTVWLQERVDLHKIGLTLVKDAVEHAARRRSVNSVITWMESEPWDQQPRLDTWLADCLGVTADPYSCAVGKNWLISMVARAYNPGCKADHMPVLEGTMGTGKSSFLKMLGDPWYSALPEAFGSKDFFQGIQGQWLIEVPDMTGFSKREHTQIIAVITTQTDRYRASFGRRTQDHPRQCLFTATSETSDYLQDSRGIRRYWPLRCQGINLDALHSQRQQLFAEAVALYKAGAKWHEMPGSTLAEQTERRNEDPWREKVLAYCQPRTEVTTADILEHCIQMKFDAITMVHKNRIASILREAGYRQYVATRDSIRMRMWTRVDKFNNPIQTAMDEF